MRQPIYASISILPRACSRRCSAVTDPWARAKTLEANIWVSENESLQFMPFYARENDEWLWMTSGFFIGQTPIFSSLILWAIGYPPHNQHQWASITAESQNRRQKTGCSEQWQSNTSWQCESSVFLPICRMIFPVKNHLNYSDWWF